MALDLSKTGKKRFTTTMPRTMRKKRQGIGVDQVNLDIADSLPQPSPKPLIGGGTNADPRILLEHLLAKGAPARLMLVEAKELDQNRLA